MALAVDRDACGGLGLQHAAGTTAAPRQGGIGRGAGVLLVRCTPLARVWPPTNCSICASPSPCVRRPTAVTAAGVCVLAVCSAAGADATRALQSADAGAAPQLPLPSGLAPSSLCTPRVVADALQHLYGHCLRHAGLPPLEPTADGLAAAAAQVARGGLVAAAGTGSGSGWRPAEEAAACAVGPTCVLVSDHIEALHARLVAAAGAGGPLPGYAPAVPLDVAWMVLDVLLHAGGPRGGASGGEGRAVRV